MAKKLSLEVEITRTGAEKSAKSIRAELKEAKEEAIALSRKFGEFSPQAIAAQQRIANLTDEMGDLNQAVQGLNPDKFARMATLTQGVVRGFQAASGAAVLFGKTGEDIEKTIAKLQATMALADGIQGVIDARKQFVALGVQVAGPLIAQFKKFSTAAKAALISTGFGAFLVALGTVAAYWDDIKEAVSGVSKEQKELNKQVSLNLKTEQGKLDVIGDQDNTLKLQGKTEKQILNIKIAQTDEVIKATEEQLKQQIALTDAQIKAEERNKQILKGLLNFVSLPITALLRGIDAIGKALGQDFKLWEGFSEFTSNLVFDPSQVKEEGEATKKELEKQLVDLKNTRDGYKLTIKEGDKKTADDRAKTAEEQRQEDLKRQLEEIAGLDVIAKAKGEKANQLVDIDLKVKETLKNNTLNVNKEQEDLVKAGADKIVDINKKKNEKLTADEKAYQDSLRSLATNGSISLLQTIDSLQKTFAGSKEAQQKKSFELSKAFSMAETAISTYQAAQTAYQSTVPGPGYVLRASVNAGLAIVAGFARVAAISKTQYNSTSTSQPTTTGNPTTTGFTFIPRPTQGRQESTQKEQNIKVHVVAKEIQKGLDHDATIQAKAIVK